MNVNDCICYISVYINFTGKQKKTCKGNNNSGWIENGQKYMKQNKKTVVSVEAG